MKVNCSKLNLIADSHLRKLLAENASMDDDSRAKFHARAEHNYIYHIALLLK
jgi:hypothetical protein